jgi:hypothetical protein
VKEIEVNCSAKKPAVRKTTQAEARKILEPLTPLSKGCSSTRDRGIETVKTIYLEKQDGS